MSFSVLFKGPSPILLTVDALTHDEAAAEATRQLGDHLARSKTCAGMKPEQFCVEKVTNNLTGRSR